MVVSPTRLVRCYINSIIHPHEPGVLGRLRAVAAPGVWVYGCLVGEWTAYMVHRRVIKDILEAQQQQPRGRPTRDWPTLH